MLNVGTMSVMVLVLKRLYVPAEIAVHQLVLMDLLVLEEIVALAMLVLQQISVLAEGDIVKKPVMVLEDVLLLKMSFGQDASLKHL